MTPPGALVQSTRMAARAGRLGAWGRLKRDLRFVGALRRTLARVKSVRPDSTTLMPDDLEAAVDKYAQRPAIVFEGRTVTYAQLDAMANRYAHWATGRGIKRGDTVALFTPNRLEYVAVWYGLSKVGVATALINNQLAGLGLVHCLDVCGAAHLILDPETLPVFESVRATLRRSMTEWILGAGAAAPPVRADRDLDRALKGVSSLRPTRETARYGVTAKDVALYIFTSGTTGLPKAARITHVRAQLYMRGFAAATEAKPTDRIYCPLPLYHATGGLCGVGAALLSGGVLLLRKRFSAGAFWTDVAEQGATMFVYIGELCRFLVNAPPGADEHRHKLRLAFGNGLRQDVWERMQARFRIPHILEFYGATEGNVSMLNFDGKPGAVGRVPKFLKKRFNFRLAKFDDETESVFRNASGRAVEARPGEIGEMLGEIRADDARANFAGYSDKASTEAKVLRDVFTPGDAWFRTGDLMRQDGEGYFYFVDRVGDTFRWKGENVATGEVAERLGHAPGVLEANVYGVAVPGAEGKAGMASLVVGPEFDLEALRARVDEELPAYARPVFLRLKTEIETTGTFKYRKIDAVAEGYDPQKVTEPLYMRGPGGAGYVPLDAKLYGQVQAGELRL